MLNQGPAHTSVVLYILSDTAYPFPFFHLRDVSKITQISLSLSVSLFRDVSKITQISLLFPLPSREMY